MSEKKNKVLDLFQRVKQLFSAEPPAPTSYKLSDGSEVTIDKLEVGGVVQKDGAAVAEGSYTLEDGTTITVDASGVITVVTPKVADPVTNPEDMSTASGIQKAMAKFATGTAEERLTSLEVIMKAVADYCFGYEIREKQQKAERDAAIAEYQNKLATQEQTMTKQEEKLTALFEFAKILVDEPVTNDPPTPPKKTFSFSKNDTKATAKEKLAAAFKQMEEERQKKKDPKAA